MTAISEDFAKRCLMFSDVQDHLPRLHDEACRDGVKVIELGVRSGNSTAAFLAAAEAHGGHVWSVDIDWAPLPDAWHQSPRWTYVIGDDLDPDIQARLPDQVDVVFIDTSHYYEHTLAELRAYTPRVKPGGVVLLHDTELEHPHQVPADDPPFPVAEALRRYATEHSLTVEWVAGCYGLGVIHVR